METEKDIGLDLLFRIIKKRIWIILAITLLTTIAAYGYLRYSYTPMYQSTVKVLIGTPNVEKLTDKNVELYQTYFQTYKDVADTYQVAKIAADKLGDGTDAGSLLDKTTINSSTGTMIISIDVKDSNAEKAYKEAQAYAEAFIERSKELNISSGNIEIVDDARLAKSPVSVSRKKKMLLAAMLGLFISAGVVLILEIPYKKTNS